MAEHSIRVSARGEFGQLERGLKNLQKDLSGVLGEIDKGARRGGIFDDTQLRALDLYRGRFKETMGEIDREFQRQNGIIDELERKKDGASRREQDNIQKEIRAREKQMDGLRKQLRTMEDIERKRAKEASSYTTLPKAPAQQTASTGSGGGAIGGLMGMGAGKMLGAGKFMAGLAGIAGIASMAQQAYDLAYQSQVTPLDLSQRMRGEGWAGSAKDMWDVSGDIGRRNQLGYTSQETWGFMDTYSQRAEVPDQQDLKDSLTFSRAYGVDTQTFAGLAGGAVGGASVGSASDFANMIAEAVGISGMTNRIVEVMEVNNALSAEMGTSFKNFGASHMLAYQTILDTAGRENDMHGLMGQEGANIISGLGGIYSPDQSNPWKWMGIQALQEYNPEKYANGNMDLYGLERSFEDGLMNDDNLPAMSKFIKSNSGGDVQVEKRMLQKWLQDGGYNATKTQTDELYEVTNGLQAFDKDKMKGIIQDLESSSEGTAESKYQERIGQLGQDILDVNARFEKQLENLGQPILEMVTGIKEGVTDILEALNGDDDAQKTMDEILAFLKDNWGLLATLAGITAMNSLLRDRLPKLPSKDKDKADKDKDKKDSDKDKKDKDNKGAVVGGKGKKGKDEGADDGKDKGKSETEKAKETRSEHHNNKKSSGGKLAPLLPAIGIGGSFALSAPLLLGGSEDTGLKEWEAEQAEKEKRASEAVGEIPIPQDMRKNPLNPADWFKTDLEHYAGALEKKIDTYKTYDNKQGEVVQMQRTLEQVRDAIKAEKRQKEMFDLSAEISILKTLGSKPGQIEERETKLTALQKEEKGYQDSLMEQHMESFASTGKEQITNFSNTSSGLLAELANGGSIQLSSLNLLGSSKLQELADRGLISIESMNVGATATMTGFTEAGKTELLALREAGLVNFDELKSGGITNLTALNAEGVTKLKSLDETGKIKLTSLQETGTKKITALSEQGAKELLDLQKNGSVSMGSMDKETKDKLAKIKKTHEDDMGIVKGEHEGWFSDFWEKTKEFFKGLFDIDWKSFFPSDWKSLLPFGDSDYGYINGGGKQVSSNVLAYKDELAKAGAKYGVNDIDLLMAKMMQESGGRGGDPMQASESLGLPRNAITDPIKSIDQGVKYFSQVLEKAGGDVELALQSYNFGSGFIEYAKERGGYSKQVAEDFSKMMEKKLGWSNYGDTNYVDNVLRYYPKQQTGGDFFKNWEGRVTSVYGSRESARNGRVHSGLDINGEQGEPIQALVDGIVKFIKYDDGSKRDPDGRANSTGGGTELGIQMANGETYWYSHLSKVAQNLKVGDQVKGGQYVANIGGDKGKPGSGYSTTGSHLHLGYKDSKGNVQDPKKLMKSLGIGDSDIAQMTSEEIDRLYGNASSLSAEEIDRLYSNGSNVSAEDVQELQSLAKSTTAGAQQSALQTTAENSTTKTINVSLKIEGEGAKELNNTTTSQLEQLVRMILTEQEQLKLSMNPTTLGWG